MPDRASLTVINENVFPVGYALPRKLPEFFAKRAKLVIVDRNRNSMRLKATNCRPEIFSVIDRVNPNFVQVCPPKSNWLQSHERHVAGKRKVSCNEPGKTLERFAVQSTDHNPQFYLQPASSGIENSFDGFIECAPCLNNKVMLVSDVRVNWNPKDKV